MGRAKIPGAAGTQSLQQKRNAAASPKCVASGLSHFHLQGAGDRDYPSRFPNALDYVVLFVLAENETVILRSPFTRLVSVNVNWQQHVQTENTQAMVDAAQELYSRMAAFTKGNLQSSFLPASGF